MHITFEAAFNKNAMCSYSLSKLKYDVTLTEHRKETQVARKIDKKYDNQ